MATAGKARWKAAKVSEQLASRTSGLHAHRGYGNPGSPWQRTERQTATGVVNGWIFILFSVPRAGRFSGIALFWVWGWVQILTHKVGFKEWGTVRNTIFY
ncbi:hypothetical protein AVEN_12445-1 [Araneus ventricosus]|uniref:Uncharacterized protein n=1 Tax=Araneus ventricosus TaxID=182803 RepID=A0A4Y2M9U0_ARAVE|nr:hypothetical protein AVEN_12445-1 [Araneus ventricosus]